MATDREAMQQMMQILGPSAVCLCKGCSWEQEEVLRLLREQGIHYQPGKGRMVTHDPNAERKGNETSEP